jgi:anthranilate/para-aminobenzoate synthase component I
VRLAAGLKRNEEGQAEHVMLVDLSRNDIRRVCERVGAGAAVLGLGAFRT